MGEGLIDLFHKKAPNVMFREGYGMTESAGALTFGRGNQAVPGSCGQLGRFYFYLRFLLFSEDLRNFK